MTDDEAQAEARRRWGDAARISVDVTTCLELCLVGVFDASKNEPVWHGAGRSWEVAFAAADLPERPKPQ